MSTAIVWFRRDLRVHDHPALWSAAREHDRLLPVFVLDARLLEGRAASSPRTSFMLGCLRALDGALHERGSALIVRVGEPESVLVELARDTGAETLAFSADVSPFARVRDARVSEALRGVGVRALPYAGTYVVEPGVLRRSDGASYSVFTPFHRAWLRAARRAVHDAPRRLPPLPDALEHGALPDQLGTDSGVDEPVVGPGEAEARSAAQAWLSHGVGDYSDRHNDLSADATSRLSPSLRWGCLSPRELEARARRHSGAGAQAWTRQLAWRDFYAHVLLAWPENLRLEFQPRLREIAWQDSATRLEAWQRGETGYPLVDAGMRQLARTGWMHNRARLVVGSFLTKDLGIDWRAGERWFSRLLLDGEPAQNNGNWQWIASVGTDPAPAYRRLYNPTLQARRFDPTGDYVRRWIPELRAVAEDRLREPWTMSEAEQRAAGCRIGRDYPEPIVDHQLERRRALERYSVAAAAPRER